MKKQKKKDKTIEMEIYGAPGRDYCGQLTEQMEKFEGVSQLFCHGRIRR